MSIKVHLIGHSDQKMVTVGDEGELEAVIHPHPPRGEAITAQPFTQYFTDDGTAAGSSDMLVDGSSTPQNFWIQADTVNQTDGGKDIYIKTVSVQISDNGARLNLFGALTALTNGIEFKHITSDFGEIVIADAIKTNLDFVRLGLGSPALGSGTEAFRADVSGSGADSYLPIIDFSVTFGMQWGLRLRAGSIDKIQFTINDNVSTLDTFNIIGYGIKF
jgi:hypothetical protein